jgi:hypothetical protein
VITLRQGAAMGAYLKAHVSTEKDTTEEARLA